MITRAYVLEVLEGELNALEEREMKDNEANALRRTLCVLIEALKLLDEGEVHPLVDPAKVKAWGKNPGSVHKLRLHAIGAVTALRKAGCSIKEADSLVADAYARTPEAIRKWRNTPVKDTKDMEAQMITGLWASRVETFNWTKHDLLQDLKRKGQEFKKAQVKKGK
jgi:hypothetical protein